MAFLIVGIFGVIAAWWVARLREPERGLSERHRPPSEDRIWTRFAGDLGSVIPPFTLYQAARCGPGNLIANIIGGGVIAGSSSMLIILTGDVMQWIALGVGAYGAFSSAQMMRVRDPATFALTWKTPAFVYAMIGFGFASMLAINMSFWTAPLALRTLPVDRPTVGMVLGATAAVFGMLGVFAGGRVSDIMISRHAAGRLHVGMAAAILPVPFVIGMCVTRDPWIFFLLNIPVVFFGTMWLGAGAATVQELVMPRMRGTATVTYGLVSLLVGSALGPYLTGKISTAHGDLAIGVMAGLPAAFVAFAALWISGRLVHAAEASKAARALAAEDVESSAVTIMN